MKAIVFGAGKIARGFIGQLLYLSKADITFVDIDQQLVDRLNKDQKYHVYILGDSSLDSDVTGFQAVQLEDEKAHWCCPCGSGYRLCFRRWCKPEVTG